MRFSVHTTIEEIGVLAEELIELRNRRMAFRQGQGLELVERLLCRM